MSSEIVFATVVSAFAVAFLFMSFMSGYMGTICASTSPLHMAARSRMNYGARLETHIHNYYIYMKNRAVKHPTHSVAKYRNSASFDAKYYRRFYLTPATRAMSREQTSVRANLIAAALSQLDIPVDRILDVGCGLGWYGRALLRKMPTATYVGTEISEYLCNKFGWLQGSITELQLKGKFDLVICADVLQYLNNRDAAIAIAKLAGWCRGALYFHAPTRRDWSENVDPSGTDAAVNLRTGSWYRRELQKHFVHAGFGLYIRDNMQFAQWELEEAR